MSPARDRVPRLLHERVAAVVERHRVDDAGLRRLIEQLLRFGGGHRQRLVGHDVLALGDRRRVDRVVQVVRRGVVHDLDVWVVEQRLVAAVRLRHAERVRLRFRGGIAAAGDRHDIDEAQPSHRVDVMGADEAGAHNPHPDPFHQEPPEAVIGTVIIYQGTGLNSGPRRVHWYWRFAGTHPDGLSRGPAGGPVKNPPEEPILRPGGRA